MARNPSLLALRAAALAFWIACVVFLLLPTHSGHDRFRGGPAAPQPMPVGGRPN